MKKIISIQLRAFFLLGVFSLNMIIGFACAIGICMWFNGNHYKKAEAITHKGCKGHNEPVAAHKSKDCNDNCCNDHVVKFSKVDKSVPGRFEGLNSIFFAALISSFFNIDVLHTSKAYVQTKYFVRSHHPPISDIRIAIQSFQI